ncbi:hypothetical protein MKY84_04715 [Chryseomicrobium sp. FSL W7-1435]|uniref:hypothetical protein n=1 Tax=Chryseomicrobium sp. FSL W7-1435 TaxID=2921704 RepID=UPI00315A4C2F
MQILRLWVFLRVLAGLRLADGKVMSDFCAVMSDFRAVMIEILILMSENTILMMAFKHDERFSCCDD